MEDNEYAVGLSIKYNNVSYNLFPEITLIPGTFEDIEGVNKYYITDINKDSISLSIIDNTGKVSSVNNLPYNYTDPVSNITVALTHVFIYDGQKCLKVPTNDAITNKTPTFLTKYQCDKYQNRDPNCPLSPPKYDSTFSSPFLNNLGDWLTNNLQQCDITPIKYDMYKQLSDNKYDMNQVFYNCEDILPPGQNSRVLSCKDGTNPMKNTLPFNCLRNKGSNNCFVDTQNWIDEALSLDPPMSTDEIKNKLYMANPDDLGSSKYRDAVDCLFLIDNNKIQMDNSKIPQCLYPFQSKYYNKTLYDIGKYTRENICLFYSGCGDDCNSYRAPVGCVAECNNLGCKDIITGYTAKERSDTKLMHGCGADIFEQHIACQCINMKGNASICGPVIGSNTVSFPCKDQGNCRNYNPYHDEPETIYEGEATCTSIGNIPGKAMGITTGKINLYGGDILCEYPLSKLDYSSPSNMEDVYTKLIVPPVGEPPKRNLEGLNYEVANDIMANYCINNMSQTGNCNGGVIKEIDGKKICPMLFDNEGSEVCGQWFNDITSMYKSPNRTAIMQPYIDAIEYLCREQFDDPEISKSDLCRCVNAQLPNDSKYANEYTSLYNNMNQSGFNLGALPCWFKDCMPTDDISRMSYLPDPFAYGMSKETPPPEPSPSCTPAAVDCCPPKTKCETILINDGTIKDSTIEVDCDDSGDDSGIKQYKYVCDKDTNICTGKYLPIGSSSDIKTYTDATCNYDCVSGSDTPSIPETQSNPYKILILVLYIIVSILVVLNLIFGLGIWYEKNRLLYNKK